MVDPATAISGRATGDDTSRFAQGHSAASAARFFRTFAGGLTVSSIGLGTGGISENLEPDATVRLHDAMELAIRGGVNLIDTSDIYGFGEAETLTGTFLERRANGAPANRSQIVICSKGGYFHPKVEMLNQNSRPLPPDFETVRQCHSIHPAFLDRALYLSARRLRVATIDAYLLHNPEEQLVVGVRDFGDRLRRAFEFLEQAVADGRIGVYGISTADALLETHPGPHALDSIAGYAREVAGDGSHFKVVQVPFNIARPHALFRQNHAIAGRDLSTLAAAAHLGLTLLTSVSINGGRVSEFIPRELRAACPELATDAQIALQFARSAPGVCTSLVGLQSTPHVIDALRLSQALPLSLDE